MSEIQPTWVFGKVAVQLGLITAEQAAEAAETQEEMEAEGIELKFGEVLLEGKMVERDDLRKILEARPDSMPDPDDALFGKIALENGLVDGDDLKEILDVQQDIASELADPEQVPKIGELLLTEEKMDAAAVEAVLEVQKRLKIGAFAPTPSRLLMLKKRKEQPLKVRNPEEALFFKVAVRKKMLTPEQVAEIIHEQMSDPRPRPAGEIAYEMGFLNQIDVADLLEMVNRKEGVKERKRKHQTTAGIKIVKEDAEFAAIALRNGFLDKKQVRKAEKVYKVLQYLSYPRNLGEVMFDLGLLQPERIKAVLDVQRLQGSVLPAYRMEEVTLTEEENEKLLAHVKEEGKINQSQVTECLRIQRELRKVGIRRRLGEIMLVKGYLFRDDLQRKPPPPRPRRRRGTPPSQSKPNALVLGLAGGGIAVVLIIVLLALSMGGDKGGGRGGKKSGDSGQTGQADPEPGKTDPAPKNPEEEGYRKIEGRWVHKSKVRAREREAFRRALRDAVRSGR